MQVSYYAAAGFQLKFEERDTADESNHASGCCVSGQYEAQESSHAGCIKHSCPSLMAGIPQ